MIRAATGAAVALVLALTAGCGAGDDSAPAGAADGVSTAGAWSPPRPAGKAAPVVDKLMVVVVENHSLDQMRSEMTFLARVGHSYGQATSYRAVTHPSLPNYLAMTGGSTYGVSDDEPPSTHQVAGPSVFGQAIAAGRTAKVYAEDMPGNCATENSGQYAVKHNAWAYHADPAEREQCSEYDVPLSELAADAQAGQLPDIGMVVPDMCHDAHDCPLSTADGFLQSDLEELMSGPDWRSGRLAIVVTADEDDYHQDNLVLTVVVHPALQAAVVDEPLTHYSLERAYSEVAGVPPLGDGASATSLLTAFGLRADQS